MIYEEANRISGSLALSAEKPVRNHWGSTLESGRAREKWTGGSSHVATYLSSAGPSNAQLFLHCSLVTVTGVDSLKMPNCSWQTRILGLHPSPNLQVTLERLRPDLITRAAPPASTQAWLPAQAPALICRRALAGRKCIGIYTLGSSSPLIINTQLSGRVAFYHCFQRQLPTEVTCLKKHHLLAAFTSLSPFSAPLPGFHSATFDLLRRNPN